MTKKKDGYHHGDLRSALVKNGLKLVAETEDGDVGLREVARETGVSATAVYRHFPDKDAFLRALAGAGFEMLYDAQAKATAGRAAKDEGFRAIGQAYVHFAIDHPRLFRLMSRYMPSADDFREGRLAKGNRAGRLLTDYLAELLPGEENESKRQVAAIQAIALVHGLAQLVLGGQIPKDRSLIDAAVDEFGSWHHES